MRCICLLLMAAAMAIASCAEPSSDAQTVPAEASAAPMAQSDSSMASFPLPDGLTPRVVVYYFHRTLRCVECLAMEALTSRAMDYFQEEQSVGRAVLRILNVEEPENEHFIDEFGIYFNTIVVAREDGDYLIWKDLGERAWELTHNGDEFIAFLVNEIAGSLAAG